MAYLKKTQDPEVVTPPTPLPVPSPEYDTETGERYTAQGQVITTPRNRYTGDTHAEIPEYEGAYLITENGTISCGGYEMISDLVVNVEPKGLTQITVTENGTYKPTEYDGYSQVVVAIPTYNGSYSVSANGTLSTKDKLMTGDLVVNVQPNLETLTVTENDTYTPTAPVQGFSSVTVNVPVGGNTLKTLLDTTKSAAYLFSGYTGNNVADLISYNDTSEVADMSYMFNNCGSITSIPLLNTSKVTNMTNMFSSCSNLTSVPLLDTSKVTNAYGMFYFCSSLTSIPQFDTSEVTSSGYMFYNCTSLTSIPLLNTSKVTNMQNMFRYCSSLTSIPALDASQVTNFGNTFGVCTALTEIKMTGMSRNFDISASTLFTREALVEIITNCATVNSRTLTMGATNLAKLTQADIDAATAKGWTIS